MTDKVIERFGELTVADENLHTTVLMNQGIYIDMIVDSVLQNMIFGGLLAVIILLFFLKDIRPTLVIACSIPVSVVFAVVLMWTGRAYLKENGQWATDAGATQAKATLKSKRKGWRKSSMASQPVEQ